MRVNLTRKVIIYLSVLSFTFCSNESSYKEGFVYMEGKDFKLDGKDFYPMILNYGTELIMDKFAFWIKPNTGYDDKDIQHTKESALHKLKADMQFIKDLGFNAVRLYGIGEYILKDNGIYKHADNKKDTIVSMEGDNMERFLTALDEVVAILDEVGLKTVFLTKKQPDSNPAADSYLIKLLNRFKNKSHLGLGFF